MCKFTPKNFLKKLEASKKKLDINMRKAMYLKYLFEINGFDEVIEEWERKGELKKMSDRELLEAIYRKLV